MRIQDEVHFSTRLGNGTGEPVSYVGTVTRVWDKPVSDPYVTVVHDGNTYVRHSSRVQPVELPLPEAIWVDGVALGGNE